MSQITGLIDGSNINHDYQVTALANSLINSGVISGLLVTTNSVALGEAFIPCTRTNGQVIIVHYQNTEAVTIDTTGTKKVWIGVDQSVIDNGSINALDGTGIATIRTGASYPAGNYLPIASITGGTITDERVFITQKPVLKKGFPLNKTVYVDPATGAEVVKDTAIGSSILDTEYVFSRDSLGNEKRILFPNLKSQLGSAGKYIQNVAIGEVISGSTPTAMAVISGSISFSNTLGSNIAGSRVKSGIVFKPLVTDVLGRVYIGQNATSASARIQLFDGAGTSLISEKTPTLATDYADFTDILTKDTEYVICINDSANFNNQNNELVLASYQANNQYCVSGFLNGNRNVNPQAIRRIDFGTKKAMKAVANSTADYAYFAGFVIGPRSIGDVAELNANDGTLVTGFTSLSIREYYISDTAGVIGTTPGTIKSRIGVSKDSTSILLESNKTILKSSTSLGSLSLVKSTAGQGYSAPIYFHGGGVLWGFTSNYTYTTATSVLQFSLDGNIWDTVSTLSHGTSGTLSEVAGGTFQRGYFRIGANPGAAFTLTVGLTIQPN